MYACIMNEIQSVCVRVCMRAKCLSSAKKKPLLFLEHAVCLCMFVWKPISQQVNSNPFNPNEI